MVTRKKHEEVKEKEPEAKERSAEAPEPEVNSDNTPDVNQEGRDVLINKDLPDTLTVINKKGKTFKVSRDYYLKNIGSVEIVDE